MLKSFMEEIKLINQKKVHISFLYTPLKLSFLQEKKGKKRGKYGIFWVKILFRSWQLFASKTFVQVLDVDIGEPPMVKEQATAFVNRLHFSARNLLGVNK